VKTSMPTLGTGIYSGRAPRSAHAGFSLLELLIVVAIIGLLVQAVTLSMGVLGNDRQIEQETGRLRGLLDLLHEEALMQSRDYGVMFTETGYRIYVFDYTQLEWVVPPADRLLEPHSLRPMLAMTLELDGRNVPLVPDFESQDVENAEPQIMLLSSGEVTPFTIEMEREGIPGHFQLTAQLDGEFSVSQEGFE
jgi:general secretion pathway protein H